MFQKDFQGQSSQRSQSINLNVLRGFIWSIYTSELQVQCFQRSHSINLNVLGGFIWSIYTSVLQGQCSSWTYKFNVSKEVTVAMLMYLRDVYDQYARWSKKINVPEGVTRSRFHRRLQSFIYILVVKSHNYEQKTRNFWINHSPNCKDNLRFAIKTNVNDADECYEQNTPYH